jgi:hypothetical protein
MRIVKDNENCEISSSQGGEYDVMIPSSLMMEAVRTYETSVYNHFTRQYIPEDNSEHHNENWLLIFKIISWRIFLPLWSSRKTAWPEKKKCSTLT